MADMLEKEKENLKILKDKLKDEKDQADMTRYQIAIKTGKKIREEAESFKNKVETLAKKNGTLKELESIKDTYRKNINTIRPKTNPELTSERFKDLQDLLLDDDMDIYQNNKKELIKTYEKANDYILNSKSNQSFGRLYCNKDGKLEILK